MTAPIPYYALVGLDAVPVEVRVDGGVVRVIDRETGGVLAARSADSGPFAGKSAPADFMR